MRHCVLLLGVLAACSRDTFATVPQDAGPSDVAPGGDAATCPILYVAPSGDDRRGGCTPADAKKHIGAAIALVKSGMRDAEIHACAGIYREASLIVDVPVSIKGGYDCTLFARTPTYGYPAFDSINETILQNANAAANRTTLTVSGAALGASVAVDGVTVVGAADTGDKSLALLVTSGASPTISNDKILGSAVAPATPLATIGLVVDSNAAPEVTNNFITGGAGLSVTNVPGSVGVSVTSDSGAPRIHGNTILGGTGTGMTIGSIGLEVYSAATLVGAGAIAGNTINGGRGSATGGGSDPSIGVLVGGTGEVALVENRIDAGKGTCGGGCASIAVLGYSPKLRVMGNRIYGGELTRAPTAPTALFDFRGIAVTPALDTVIVNNMIHVGNVSQSVLGGGRSVGIQLVDGAGAFVAHNTVVAGAPRGGPVYLLEVNAAHTGATVENNLFIGAADVGGAADLSFGVFVAPCAGASIGALRNNAFVNIYPLAVTSTVSVTCDTRTLYKSISSAETEQNILIGLSARANFMVTKACDAADTPTKCSAPVACASPYPACVTTVLETFDGAAAGASDLDGPGWTLRGSGVCGVMNGGADLTTARPVAVASDFFGKARIPPPSIGAHENHAGCR